MLKSMLIHQRDSKGIVKPNFVTSCLAFRGSIPTNLRKGTRTQVSFTGWPMLTEEIIPWIKLRSMGGGWLRSKR